MDFRFSKIRYSDSDESVELEYDETKGKDVVHSELKSPAAPEPEFIATLRAFKPEMLRVLELPRPYGENFEVHQVSISYRNDRRGIVISARKKLGDTNSPFNVHTPYLPEPDEAFSNKGMSSAMVDLLNNLEKLAEAYLDGTRAQQELALGASQNGGKKEQADIEDPPQVLPKVGAKLKFTGDTNAKRVYRVTKVSSERLELESKGVPMQIARVDQVRWSDFHKMWLTDFLYDPESEMVVTERRDLAAAAEEMPV